MAKTNVACTAILINRYGIGLECSMSFTMYFELMFRRQYRRLIDVHKRSIAQMNIQSLRFIILTQQLILIDIIISITH